MTQTQELKLLVVRVEITANTLNSLLDLNTARNKLEQFKGLRGLRIGAILLAKIEFESETGDAEVEMLRKELQRALGEAPLRISTHKVVRTRGETSRILSGDSRQFRGRR